MLRPRIIPCLLVQDRGLVKTKKFGEPKYVGDPMNAVRIFNEKGVDELIVLDIDATRHGKSPDFKLIENLASESRMPLCYGGGITNADDARKIIGLGVEKVALSAAAIKDPDLLSRIADSIGRQSVVAVLDIKKTLFGLHEVWTHNGTKNTGLGPADLALKLEKAGAGEIVLNSIDHDGMMNGYDLALVRQLKSVVSVPLTIMGGVGSLADIGKAIENFGIIGAAAGSLFVFKGIYRAVLINYPAAEERDQLVKTALAKFEKCR